MEKGEEEKKKLFIYLHSEHKFTFLQHNFSIFAQKKKTTTINNPSNIRLKLTQKKERIRCSH